MESEAGTLERLQRLRPKRTIRGYLAVAARGFCMGCADVVPGVSGGTMAFILGIYEELIESIRAIASTDMVQSLLQLRIRRVLDLLSWRFLGSLLAGILLAILTLAHLLEWLLREKPVYLWSFFFGLVLASVYSVAKRKTKWTWRTTLATLAGTVLAYLIVGLVPLQTPEEAWFLFLSGAIAICAMILPGISGAFILLILGKYEFVLQAVNQRDIGTIAIVGAGCAIGIMTFAQVLSWLFRRWHDLTIAVLIGLMVGSLRKVWPWKETLEWMEDRHGHLKPLLQRNVLPDSWSQEVTFALLLGILGLVVVLVLDRMAGRATMAKQA